MESKSAARKIHQSLVAIVSSEMIKIILCLGVCTICAHTELMETSVMNQSTSCMNGSEKHVSMQPTLCYSN